MELGNYSLAELQRLRHRIDTEITRRNQTAKRDLLKKMQKLAADHGLSLEDVVGTETSATTTTRASSKASPKAKAPRKSAVSRKTGPVAPKYRHPEDATLTWTGRGRQPLWVRSWLESGHTLESIVIEKEEPAPATAA